MTRALGMMGAAAVMTVGTDCSGSEAVVGVDAATATHTVRYRLAWDWGTATPNIGGPGWQVENDLGYRIRVERGYLVNHSMELIECNQTAPSTSWLRSLLQVRPAYAGHGSDMPNPAKMLARRIEDLSQPAAVEVGLVDLDTQLYCGTHYLVGRADELASPFPAEVDMLGRSLYLEGTYLTESGEQSRFVIATSLGNGVIRYLAESIDVGEYDVAVEVRRDLSALFDGVDFQAMGAYEIERQILRSLIENTQVVVTTGDYVEVEDS